MMRKVVTALSLAVAASAAAVELTESQRAEIEARIAPIGEVCLQGDNSCGGSTVAAADTDAGPRSGEEVFNSACMACHSTGAGGAPKVGDVEAWAPRLAKGIDALHQSGIKGVTGTGMMAKGGCANCSDDEIVAAVDYMIENSQ